MKEHTLLDLVGKIDDSLIEEAAHPEILLARQRKRRRAQFARRVGSIAACFVIAIGVIVAIPSLRMMEKVQAEADMNSAISVALNEQVNLEASKQAAVDSSLADSAQASVSYEAEAAMSSLAAAAMEASKAAAEASKAAAEAEKMASVEASKAVADASKAAAEASKPATEASKPAAEASKTVSAATTAPQEPMTETYRDGELTYTYSDQTLYSLEIVGNYRLTDLVLPAEITGVKLTELDSDFWRFCDANPNLKTVTMPESITIFGDVEYLSREVEIICAKDSAAEKFFIEKGYTVKNP